MLLDRGDRWRNALLDDCIASMLPVEVIILAIEVEEVCSCNNADVRILLALVQSITRSVISGK
jgi:hypothetical protein